MDVFVPGNTSGSCFLQAGSNCFLSRRGQSPLRATDFSSAEGKIIRYFTGSSRTEFPGSPNRRVESSADLLEDHRLGTQESQRFGKLRIGTSERLAFPPI